MFDRMLFCSAVILSSALGCLYAHSQEGSDHENKLRIQELIPDCWAEFPAIEPAIPLNYKLGELQKFGVSCWGTPEDIMNFNGDNGSIRSELIVLNLAPGLRQIAHDQFAGEEAIFDACKHMGCEHFQKKKLYWGNYPVIAVEGEYPDCTPFRCAWVGLNSASGTTILLDLHTPKSAHSSCTVWNELLNNTKQLEEPDLFRAQGMNMKDGYTIYSDVDATLKATAEKRTSDDLLAIRIEPLTPDTTYELSGIKQCLMGTRWKFKEPCTKICGTTIRKNGKFGECYFEGVITVLTKNVDNFSFDLDPNNHPHGVVVATMQEDGYRQDN